MATAVENRIHALIHDVLRNIVTNFSSDDCADIVIESLQKVVDDNSLQEDLVHWATLVQLSGEETGEI